MATDEEKSNQGVRLTLEGTYTPARYFEEPVCFEEAEYDVEIVDGKIIASIKDPDPQVGKMLGDEIDRKIKQIFDAQQVLTSRSHERTALGMVRYRPDGKRDIWVSASSAMVVATVNPVDLRVTDASGNVVRDSKAERLDDQRQFREQCRKHIGDQALSKLLISFKQAIDDRPNMLVHLYEVRDALKDRFGGEPKARGELQISKRDWSDLGKLSNDEPVQEGRHRGLHGELRAATEEELDRARSIAQRMIRAYLNYLDRSEAASS